MPGPLVSIIVPVYNRQEELRRALRSVADQTVSDFECLVVDDGSTEPIKQVVDEFDDRFCYVRRSANGGPTAARLTGCKHAKGDFVGVLDSDNEFFPWALERASHHLRAHPEVDGATGLYVFPEGFRVRVAGGTKLVGPDEYVAMSSPRGGDSVSLVRQCVVEEWRGLRGDYFNLDLALLLTLRMSHFVLRVDEPWGRYHRSAADRMSHRRDPRSRGLDDIEKFVHEFRPRLGSTPCGPLDMALTNMWVRLIRNHRYRQAIDLAAWMRERGITQREAARRKATWVLQTRVATARRRPRVLVI